jgi:hypothetical protein
MNGGPLEKINSAMLLHPVFHSLQWPEIRQAQRFGVLDPINPI